MDMEHTKNACQTHSTLNDVIAFVMPYITEPEDRRAASLVSRRWYEIDGETREHVTVRLCYATTPERLSRRFPSLKSLRIDGAAGYRLIPDDWGGSVTPWVEEIAKSLNLLESVHFRRMIVSDSDLETLAEARGEKLHVLKLSRCIVSSTDGLRKIALHCRRLKTFYLRRCHWKEFKDDKWLHEIASTNTCLQILNVDSDEVSMNIEDLEQIARNCPSLISTTISSRDLLDLQGFFQAATNLEKFSAGYIAKDSPNAAAYVNMDFPHTLCRLGLIDMGSSQVPMIFAFAGRLEQLNLTTALLTQDDHCAILQACPNLIVFKGTSLMGDRAIEVLAQHCKKMKKLKLSANEEFRIGRNLGYITHRALTTLAQGCQRLRYLDIAISDMTNDALENVGKHLKELGVFRLTVLQLFDNFDQPIHIIFDNGVRELLRGCSKLQTFYLCLERGLLTSIGMQYVGEYGLGLKWLNLCNVGASDEGLLQLSRGCQKLERLELECGSFSGQAVADSVQWLRSVRFIWVEVFDDSEVGTSFQAMARPNWNMELTSFRSFDDRFFYASVVRHFIAYYSLAGQRTDFPREVRPLSP